MFRFAHSLGYPHPNVMLASMSSLEYREVLTYFKVESELREEREAIARDANLRAWFDRKHAQQKERKSG